MTGYLRDKNEAMPVGLAEPAGVWAVTVLGSDGLYVNEVHPTELEALRAAVALSAMVLFLPYGVHVYEAAKR